MKGVHDGVTDDTPPSSQTPITHFTESVSSNYTREEKNGKCIP